MINLDDVTKENIKEHNQNWQQIPDYSCRILIIGGLGSGKTNSLLNLISHRSGIDKIYLYDIDPYKAKYQFLINKREITGLKHFNDSKTFIEYPNDMNDIYKNIDEYIPNKKRKILIAFNDIIADMLSNKKFISGRKLNIYLAFITNFFLLCQKILGSTHYSIMKIPNKLQLQQIAINLHHILTSKTL